MCAVTPFKIYNRSIIIADQEGVFIRPSVAMATKQHPAIALRRGWGGGLLSGGGRLNRPGSAFSAVQAAHCS